MPVEHFEEHDLRCAYWGVRPQHVGRQLEDSASERRDPCSPCQALIKVTLYLMCKDFAENLASVETSDQL